MMGQKSNQLRAALDQFIGTEHWYSHPFERDFLYTDGVRYFARNAGNGAYWFIDLIATELFRRIANQTFLSLSLMVRDNAARLIATDGNGGELYHRDIDFTDAPEGEWRFYLIDNVLLLPSEY